MTIIELLKKELLKFPLEQPKNKQFDKFIKDYLNSFLEKVENLEQGFENNGINFIKNSQRRAVQGLIKTIEQYYKGNPSNAYKELEKTLKNDVKNLHPILKKETYPQGENFYRIRTSKENYTFNKKEMFHIPFELRGKVSTQRYSIPGFPSLYLGKSLYVCWEELKRPSVNDFQVVRLNNKKPIRYLDLSPPYLFQSDLTLEIYRYFMIFPLVACCSVKVKNYDDTFKPEYIVPQLLLQWVRNNDAVDGIRYKSTNISKDLYQEKGELSNIVLPVKENKNTGLCNKLKTMFDITEPFSWELKEVAQGGVSFIGCQKENEKLDSRLPEIELIKGRKTPYSYSILGKIEQYVDGLDIGKI